jgi:hypothetical protein
VPRLCELYPGICLTSEEKARKNLSQGSRRMLIGKEYTEQSIHVNKTIKIHNLHNLKKYTTHTTIYRTIKKNQKTSLHCNTLLHFTTLHPTALHYTYRHFTPSHLHFTTLSFGLTHLRFLPLRVRITMGALMSVSCDCCVVRYCDCCVVR